MACGSPEPSISFIIPAYNIVDYLDQCMESIVAQTFGDFEVLLVDDGSIDGTGERCEEWSRRDARVFCVHKENGGVSSARNLGIELARGEYLAFVDPDDWLDERYLELLYDAAVREDAVFAECDIWRYDNRTGKKIHRSCGQRMGVRFTLEEHMRLGPTACYKSISKRSLWIENDVRFPDCSFESPAIYALVLALAGERCAYIPEPLYYYRRFRSNSLVETAYASVKGAVDNTLGVDALGHLINEFQRRGLMARFGELMPGIVSYRLNDILAMQYHRRSAEDFAQLVANQRSFLARSFPGIPQAPYITWGGYNLNKIMQHLPLLNDPSCRFNFSSVAAVAYPVLSPAQLTVKHSNRYRQMMIDHEIAQTFWKVLECEKPAFIFMDFVDERFDLIEWGGRFITESDAFSGACIEGCDLASCRRLRFGTKEHEEAWSAAFASFVERLAQAAPDTQLVFVENYLSEWVGSADNVHEYDDVESIRATNDFLRRLYALAFELCPQAMRVQATTCDWYYTDEGYEYGAVPQHLNDIVNERIAQLICEVVL